MTRNAQAALNPRKSPVQTRSAVTVDAILQATIQVLLAEGKEKLTTTRVAHRAGVSVGTLYQYFPNKSALLQEVLRRYMEQVAEAVESVCHEQRGRSLAEMATALADAYLAAKMRKAKVSAALHAVSSDVDGLRVVRKMAVRMNKQIVALFASAPEPLAKSPEVIAEILQGVLSGIGRRLTEMHAPEKHYPELREELLFLVRAYAVASLAHSSRKGAA